MPNSGNVSIVEESCETIPLDSHTTKLYESYVTHIIHGAVKNYCLKNFRKYAYSYKDESTFYTNVIDAYGREVSSQNLGVNLRYKFTVKPEIHLDGSIYMFVKLKTDFNSRFTIYDYIMQGKNPVGMKVEYLWDNFPNLEVMEVSSHMMSETVDGFCLENYWRDKASWRLNGIDCRRTPIVKLKDGKGRIGSYVPQSLKPVITYEFVNKHDNKFLSNNRRHIQLTMQQRLDIITNFLNDVNSSFKEAKVCTTPVPTAELGYNLVNLESNLPRLIVANNHRLTIKQKYQVFNYGFYRLPKSKLCGACMYPEDYKNEYTELAKVVLKYLNDGYLCTKKLLPMAYDSIAYPYTKGDMLSYKEVATKIKHLALADFVLSVLPFDESQSPYEPFKDVFAELSMPSQMVSLESFKTKTNDYDRQNYLQNVALGILCKCGGVPWVLERPLNGVDCFIGLDIGMQEKGIHIPASSVCLDGNGNLIGYYMPKNAQSGEKMDKPMLEDILGKVLLKYQELYNRYPKHMVVHRDGFSNEETSWYSDILAPRGIEYDLVEVKKNINQKLMDLSSSDALNPLIGTCVVNGDSAYLVTTKITAKRGGSPRPIELVHKYGNLSTEDIAKQVYVLSQIHVGSTLNGRLPITTLYADKICKKHKFIPSGKVSNNLYFL
jgi:argonaute-like protein implicated in RNA metabolism and viral defense